LLIAVMVVVFRWPVASSSLRRFMPCARLQPRRLRTTSPHQFDLSITRCFL
jgi:hypothetical protein